MKPFSGLLLSILCISPCVAAEYPVFDESHDGRPLDISKFKLAWQEEFDTLPATNARHGKGPWFPGVHAVLASGEKMAWLPDPAYSVSNGILKMSTRLDPADSLRVEAHLQTDDHLGNSIEFQDGYVEARIWLPAALGSHAGLWLLSREEGKGHSEVDIVETYGNGDFGAHSSTHVWPIAPAKHQYDSSYKKMPDIFKGYHLYGVLALERQYVFYINRQEVARIERLPAQRVPHYIALSVFGNPAQPVIQPAEMLVDYVRIYNAVPPLPPTLMGVD